MKILYLSLSYVPSRRASTVQVMRMCEAFAEAGHQVTLVAKRGTSTDDPYEAYGVARNFQIDLIARPAWRGGGVVYLAGVIRRVLAGRDVDLVYCRDLIGAAVAAELGLPVAFEIHGIYDRDWQRRLLRRTMSRRSFRGLVAISQAMVSELRAIDLLPADRPVVIAHSPASAAPGVTPKAAVSSPPRIGYVGSMYAGRGVELVIEIAARMPAYAFELVGGTDEDLARLQASKLPPNVTLRGFVAPGKIPAVYRELDVLLMPYPRTGVHGPTRRLDTASYCSPMKMFEYMASGVPMVASDLPVLGEVITDGNNALVAPSGDPIAWQAAIERLVRDRELRVSIARRALDDLAVFTPQARVTRILLGLSASL